MFQNGDALLTADRATGGDCDPPSPLDANMMKVIQESVKNPEITNAVTTHKLLQKTLRRLEITDVSHLPGGRRLDGADSPEIVNIRNNLALVRRPRCAIDRKE